MANEGSDTGTAFDVRNALSWLGLILLMLAVIGLIWYGGTVLLLVFFGILLAVVLRAPIGFLVRRTGMPDRLAFFLVVLAVIAVLVGFSWLVGPRIVQQAGQFTDRLPGLLNSARDFLEERPWGSWIVDLVEQEVGGQGQGGDSGPSSDAQSSDAQSSAADQPGPGATGDQGSGSGAEEGQSAQGSGSGGSSGALSDGGAAIGQLASTVTGTASRVVSTLVTVFSNLALVVVVALFFAFNPTLYRTGLVRLFPASAQQRASEVIDEIGTTLKFWLLGQMALMLITGTLTGIGLLIIGVPLALGLAFFVGLMEFIPFIGPIIGFIPIVMLAAVQGGSTFLWAVILYLVIQQVEGNLLQPIIQKRTVTLPPALTLTAVFLGGALFGILGAILATPLMAVIYVTIKMLYVHDVLGQPVHVPGHDESSAAQS